MIERNFSPLSDISSLEDFLKDYLGISKNQLKKYIPQKSLKKSFKARSSLFIPLEILNNNKINPLYEGEKPKVILDDKDFLVLSKPNKIHSHPLSFCETNNVLSFIRSQFPSSYLNVNNENYDRGLLYRLDYETSGLLIYCKNKQLHKKLRENFNELTKTKIYYALVDGTINLNLDLNHYLHTSLFRGSKIVVSDTELTNSKKARILVRPVENMGDRTKIEVELFQGHRHQIRAQLAYIGHPILGDELYGGKIAEKLHLHCFSYQIEERIFIDQACPF